MSHELKSDQEFDQLMHREVLSKLDEIDKNLPRYLLDQSLAYHFELYQKRMGRMWRVAISFEKYRGHARDHIGRYLNIRRRLNGMVLNNQLPSSEELILMRKESDWYYNTYQEIIDSAEKFAVQLVRESVTGKVVVSLGRSAWESNGGASRNVHKMSSVL